MKFAGKVAELKPGPIVAGAVTAALKPQLDTVNTVNALEIAKDRGISITEERTETSPNFGSTITVSVCSGDKTFSATGALFGGEPRLVRIDDVRLEATFAENMLYIVNDDKPGMIGSLGDALRQANVNIATGSGR